MVRATRIASSGREAASTSTTSRMQVHVRDADAEPGDELGVGVTAPQMSQGGECAAGGQDSANAESPAAPGRSVRVNKVWSMEDSAEAGQVWRTRWE